MKQSYCVGALGKKAVEPGSSVAMKRKEPPVDGETAEEEPPKKTTLKPGMHPTRQQQVSEEELEEYKRKRSEFEDPMRNAAPDGDGLLPL